MKQTLSLLILNYLRFFARLELKKNPRAIVIGITGSAGKTSARLALFHILKHKARVKHSVHANSESGIPLNILGLKMSNYRPLDWLKVIILAPLQLLLHWEQYDYYLVEMGIDSPSSPKNMEYLLTIIQPDIAVVLNAGLVHGAEFDHLVEDKNPVRRVNKIRSLIAQEKMKLATSLDATGVAVINLDQKEFRNKLSSLRSRILTFGQRTTADLRFDQVKPGPVFSMRLLYQDKKYHLVLRSAFEQAYSYTFAAAIAAAAALGVSIDKSIDFLRDFQAPSGRMRLYRGINGTHLIDSSYNASPDTMLGALKFLNSVAGRHRKIAVLGDMRELGINSKAAHKNLAEQVQKYASECVLFGSLTQKYTLPILMRTRFPVKHFSSIASLNQYLQASLHEGDWVLIKGSQNTIFLERTVASLLADHHDAATLCRRGVYWDNLRAKAP